MAIKVKQVEEKSKLLEVLTTEYKWENLLLGILATVSGALALMIITGGPNSLLQINENFPVLGQGNNGLIFAWVLFAISVFGLILVIYPFFLPAFPELKKITWPSWPKFLDHSVRVLIFVFILTGLILLFNIFIKFVLGGII